VCPPPFSPPRSRHVCTRRAARPLVSPPYTTARRCRTPRPCRDFVVSLVCANRLSTRHLYKEPSSTPRATPPATELPLPRLWPSTPSSFFRRSRRHPTLLAPPLGHLEALESCIGCPDRHLTGAPIRSSQGTATPWCPLHRRCLTPKPAADRSCVTPRPRSSPSPALSSEHLAGIPAPPPHAREPNCMVRILFRGVCANRGQTCEGSKLSRGLLAKGFFTHLGVLAAACKIHRKS
jgi:hypothetical protein